MGKTYCVIVCAALLLGPVQSLRAQRGMGRGDFGGSRRSSNTQLVDNFDKDRNGWLNAEERMTARQSMGRSPSSRSGSSSSSEYQYEGPYNQLLSPADVNLYSDEPLYDLQTLRTLFLEFENDDWETELEDFHDTDVDVPAQLTVDGKIYDDVGVRFRGNSSYSSVDHGWKRSLNLSIDYVHSKQRLYGYRTLNLLNSNTDPTFVRTILYQQIALDYIPALKANYVRVVINGESWGIYINIQQFNTDFIKEWFDTRDGARWKVPQMSRNGGLVYLGESPQSYKGVYEIKSKDDPNSWADLINLCRVLNQTPTDELEEALEPILDIDGTLRFLALDKALINNDGYWTRASDYLIYQDKDGRFHIIPYDTNEGLRPANGGRGGFGSSSVSGNVQLDPFAGANDSGKPLLSKLLAVPSLRERYLSYIRDVAENWLHWSRIYPMVQQYQSLISADVKTDARKLYSSLDFYTDLILDLGGTSSMSLKSFVEQRREYLLKPQTQDLVQQMLREFITGTRSQRQAEM